MTLTLAGPNDTGAAVALTTTTNAVGEYIFTALRPGIYTLTERQPDGYSDGIDRSGFPTGAPSQDSFGAIVLSLPGTNAGNYLFGERQNGLTGYVYNDVTGDGIRQGFEQGIGGVQVTLSGTLAGGSHILSTTETNYGGFFSFSDLLTGTYELI